MKVEPPLVEIVAGTRVFPGDVVRCGSQRTRVSWPGPDQDFASFTPIKLDGTKHRGVSGWSGKLRGQGYLLEQVPPKGISIRQPWPWAILHAGKRIENRDNWRMFRFRGRVLIHASKAMTWKEWVFGSKAIHAACGRGVFPSYDQFMGHGQLTLTGRDEVQLWGDSLRLGGVVGRAVVVDCILPGGMACEPDGARHALATDPWYQGAYGLVLANVEPIPFVPCAGALGLWDVPPDVIRATERQPQGTSTLETD